MDCQPGNPRAPDVDAICTEGTVYPVSAVGALGLGVDGGDAGLELGIGHLPGAGGGVALLVVGGPGDLEQRTGAVDAVVPSLLRLDERPHRHRVSLAKKAVARFRISRSSRSWRFSLRRTDSSSRSALCNPGRAPSSTSA